MHMHRRDLGFIFEGTRMIREDIRGRVTSTPFLTPFLKSLNTTYRLNFNVKINQCLVYFSILNRIFFNLNFNARDFSKHE